MERNHEGSSALPIASRPESWLRVTPAGLFCEPGGFHIDPVQPVDGAIVTHGHSDHARPGHRNALATAETIAIMRQRYRDDAGGGLQALSYGAPLLLRQRSIHRAAGAQRNPPNLACSRRVALRFTRPRRDQ
jgi:hypothetical protein